jgi:hypothetical protein
MLKTLITNNKCISILLEEALIGAVGTSEGCTIEEGRGEKLIVPKVREVEELASIFFSIITPGAVYPEHAE